MGKDAHESSSCDTNQQHNGSMDGTTVTHVVNVESEVMSSSPKMDENTSPTSNPQGVVHDETPRVDPDIPLDHLSQEISQFATSLSLIDESHPLETPKYVGIFLDKVESKLEYYESDEPSPTTKLGHSLEDDSSFFMVIHDLALLVQSVSKFKPTSNSAIILLNMATSQLHRAMLVLEEELCILLNKWKDGHTKSQKQQLQQQDNQPDHCILPDRQQQLDSNHHHHQQQDDVETFPYYSSEDISIMSSISSSMITIGYEVECIKSFMIMRRSAVEDELTSQGFEKMSIDDVQRMQWETLEGKISSWIHILKHCTLNLFPSELKFYQVVFSSTPSQSCPTNKISTILFSHLTSSILHQLVNLANAVSMTKKSSEKLFKFLDMYEIVRDLKLWLVESSSFTNECKEDLRFEIGVVEDCLGESIVSIFNELEMSIKNDNAKQPVPNGAVHPLTRYTMNYLEYACSYKDNLEELFMQRHLNQETSTTTTPFTAQLMTIMDLLDANLETKSKLYKDPSLRYIFLMNNGRYILQKIRGAAEIRQVVGDSCCRKRSSELRNYHKNYQRDTWSKVLQCLSHEGIQVNGKVQKPILKERFKNFNQLFDEIHKIQSTWVVSDEQLRSELRVSISAIMTPAYRAFHARFGQIFTPGRQYEKHIKYQPEDIETAIEELFDGSVNSMARRRN